MLDCNILTKIEDVEGLAPDWKALYDRRGADYFAGYLPFKVWWDTIAQEKPNSLHIVTAREDGKLVGLLPLVVCYKRGFRILFWAGYDAFIGDLALYEDSSVLAAMWKVVAQSRLFDAAELRYVKKDSPMQKVLAQQKWARVIADDFLTSIQLKGQKGEEWVQGLPKKMRNESRRKLRNLERAGEVVFSVYEKEIPSGLIKSMVDLKRDWCVERGFDSRAFFNVDYIPHLIEEAGKLGEVRFFSLSLDDVPISFALGFMCKTTIYTSVVAYDPSFTSVSPGVLVLVRAVMWCADHGVDEFSFMEGREDFKAKYGNHRETIVTYSFAQTLWGLTARTLLGLRHNEGVKQVLQRLRQK